MLLDDALAAGTPLADVLPLGDDVLEIETLYNRPDLTSVYGIAREVAALTGGELKPMPGTSERLRPATETSASRSRSTISTRARGSSRGVLPRRSVGESPAVAEGAADRRRHAPDLERRRHHELRDARARQPAARATTPTRSPAAGSSCGARGPGEELVTLDGTRRAARPRGSRDRRCRARRSDSPA